MRLIIEPADGVAPLLTAIERAKTSVEVAIFRLDRKDVESALKTAAARGVRVTALIAFAVIPLGTALDIGGYKLTLYMADVNIAVLYILAIGSLSVYGIVLAGWSSNNKYALLGALRSRVEAREEGWSWVDARVEGPRVERPGPSAAGAADPRAVPSSRRPCRLPASPTSLPPPSFLPRQPLPPWRLRRS